MVVLGSYCHALQELLAQYKGAQNWVLMQEIRCRLQCRGRSRNPAAQLDVAFSEFSPILIIAIIKAVIVLINSLDDPFVSNSHSTLGNRRRIQTILLIVLHRSARGEIKGDGQSPRLAGQLYEYVTRNLANWEKERRQDGGDLSTSATMQAIARDLGESQIKAVAAYVSQLE
jgi:hypothetical protein